MSQVSPPRLSWPRGAALIRPKRAGCCGIAAIPRKTKAAAVAELFAALTLWACGETDPVRDPVCVNGTAVAPPIAGPGRGSRMLRPRSEARRSCSGAALPRRWETPAAPPNGESVGGGEEGDVDVGEVVDEPQSETAASGTARGARTRPVSGSAGPGPMSCTRTTIRSMPVHSATPGSPASAGTAAVTAVGWNPRQSPPPAGIAAVPRRQTTTVRARSCPAGLRGPSPTTARLVGPVGRSSMRVSSRGRRLGAIPVRIRSPPGAVPAASGCSHLMASSPRI